MRSARRDARAPAAPSLSPSVARTSSSSTSAVTSTGCASAKSIQTRSAPLPLSTGNGKRQPLAPRGDVGVVEAQVQLALQLVPVLQRFTGHVAAQLERRGERRRAARPSGRPDGGRSAARAGTRHDRAAVAARCGIRRPTRPARHGRRLALAHQPVGDGGIVAGARRVRARCRRGATGPPRRGAATSRGPSISSSFRRRSSSGSDVHATSRSTRGSSSSSASSASRVADAEAADGQLRIPAVPAGDDGVDLDRLADALRQPLRDVVAMRFDLRERRRAESRAAARRTRRRQQHAPTSRRAAGRGAAQDGVDEVRRHNEGALTRRRL